MADAVIVIEDGPPDGRAADRPTVLLRLVFSGGFQPRSAAHQAAQALLKLWDRELGVQLGVPRVDPIVIAPPEPLLAVPEGATVAGGDGVSG